MPFIFRCGILPLQYINQSIFSTNSFIIGAFGNLLALTTDPSCFSTITFLMNQNCSTLFLQQDFLKRKYFYSGMAWHLLSLYCCGLLYTASLDCAGLPLTRWAPMDIQQRASFNQRKHSSNKHKEATTHTLESYSHQQTVYSVHCWNLVIWFLLDSLRHCSTKNLSECISCKTFREWTLLCGTVCVFVFLCIRLRLLDGDSH